MPSPVNTPRLPYCMILLWHFGQGSFTLQRHTEGAFHTVPTEPLNGRQGDAATALFTAIILILGLAVGAWKVVHYVAQFFDDPQTQDHKVVKETLPARTGASTGSGL